MNQESSSNNSSFSLLIFCVLLGLALIVLISFLRAPKPGAVGGGQVSAPVITSSVTHISDETQTVVAIVEKKLSIHATYLATTRTPVTPIYLPTGIYDDQRVKISAALLFIDAQNAWGGFIDGYRFVLYAGSQQSDPDQGVVEMVTSLPQGKLFEQFITPTKHGALRVVSEQNNRLSLIALDGMEFYFDIPTRQFVASLTDVAPSVTPSPLVTPAAGSPLPTFNPYPMPTGPGTEAP